MPLVARSVVLGQEFPSNTYEDMIVNPFVEGSYASMSDYLGSCICYSAIHTG
jgi:hypothetical protein